MRSRGALIGPADLDWRMLKVAGEDDLMPALTSDRIFAFFQYCFLSMGLLLLLLLRFSKQIEASAGKLPNLNAEGRRILWVLGISSLALAITMLISRLLLMFPDLGGVSD
jgi:hypothetical protein